jgi:heat shock protein HtpX
MNLSAYKTGNQFKTFIFLAAMTALLLGIGYLIGGTAGLVLFLFISIGMNFAMYWWSGPMALRMSRARKVSEDEEPELHRQIAALAHRAGVPMPGVYVIPSEQPNAFATGRNPQHAAIAVTEGIQRMLSPRELEGVLAHEMAHVKNRDILIASIAAMIAGAISYLMYALLFFGGDDENPLGVIGSLLMFFLAPLAAGILQMAISRQREYVADATGAELLGDPLPLADALSKLQAGADRIPMQVNQAAAPLYIVNPLAALRGRGMSKLFSTHPPTEERIARLRRMAGMRGMELATF